MAKNRAAKAAPNLSQVVLGLDTNEFTPCIVALEVTGAQRKDVVSIKLKRDPTVKWDGKLRKNVINNFWLVVLKYTGRALIRSQLRDVDTVTVTVTSGGQQSNPQDTNANIYNSDP